MTPEAHDDELAEQLAEREAMPASPQADTGPLAQVQGELATLSEQLRRPEPVDPFGNEPDCQAAVERAAGLAHDSSQETFVAQPAYTEQSAEIELGVLGHYKLLAKLGQGGMGAVYKALHTKLDRVVALKVLPAGRLGDQQAVSRFEREMRAVGKLQHPHIVAAHDAGEVDGTHYLVMELVEGADLAGLVQKRGPLPIAAACEMVRQAALGLAHAQKHGLVHRDIKPSNLMLSKPAEPGAPPIVKVLDLGLALLNEGQVEAAGELTSTGQVMGTIDYMAPEQGTDTHKVDIRADIYSLGATLYKLLTGKAPFAGAQYDTAVKKLMALATKEPPPVGTLRPDCPPELAKLVHQMLAKTPDERPATPAALTAALEPFARGADLRMLLEPATGTEAELSQAGTVPFSGYTAASAYDETHIADAAAIPVTAAIGTPSRRTPRRRWLIGLGGLAAAVACGVVITIATDHGTVEIDAAEGVNVAVTVLRNDQPVRENWQIKPGDDNKTTVRTGRVQIVLPSDKQDEFEVAEKELVVRRGKTTLFTVRKRETAKAPDIVAGQFDPGRPIDIPEPPPLEEWLKGREVLTVSKDGSAQFTTIQAALNALQAGQVVKVLDSGPYRERLELQEVPADTGLVSEAGTVLDLPEYFLKWKAPTFDNYVGHAFRNVNGFRIAGFALGFPAEKPEVAYGLELHRAGSFLLERCWVKGPIEVLFGHHDGGNPLPSCLRECLFEGRLHVGTVTSSASTLIVRNFFGAKEAHAIVVAEEQGDFSAVGIRENIFAGERRSLEVVGLNHAVAVDISNNTFLASQPFVFARGLPQDHVTICNNLRTRAGFIGLLDIPAEGAAAIRRWTLNRNCYPCDAIPSDFGWRKENVFPRAPSDIIGTPKFLSTVPGEPGYLRIAVDDPLARAGAGGAWPSHIGAFPPGRAPKDGDWFTRLRQRWPDAFANQSTTAPVTGEPVPLVEPPPLAEWFKGREVLTVAQDGSAQFKTIGAALRALKPHQVVRVLDRGPYLEFLRSQGLPDDTGLITETGCVIQAPEKSPGGPDDDWDHQLAPLDGFRLHGFHFDRLPGTGRGTLYCGNISGLVIEHCRLTLTAPHDDDDDRGGILLGAPCSNANARPNFIRECFFDGQLLGIGEDLENTVVVVERNYFRSRERASAWLAANTRRLDTLLVRHNVFDNRALPDSNPIWVGKVKEVGEVLAFSNNTLAVGGILTSDAMPERGLLNRNNLSELSMTVATAIDQSRLAELRKNWVQDHNGYIRAQMLGKFAGDVTVDPGWLSLDPRHSDFLRIPLKSPLADGGAGASWPTYIGALEPGPAPKDGDWFTRLRARWLGGNSEPGPRPAALAIPLQIPEPAPLEEWLKGRTVLTVAQDGSGQFTTIRAAMEAVQPGQVVRVLDRGPYHESLRGTPARDTGLISEVKTVLDVKAWPAAEHPHILTLTGGFRLNGFRFQAQPRDGWFEVLHVAHPGGLVIENCSVGLSASNHTDYCAGLVLAFGRKEGEPPPVWVRDCIFERQIGIAGDPVTDAVANAAIVIERSLFRETSIVPFKIELRTLVIRHNVFDNETTNPVNCVGVTGIRETLEICNNTASHARTRASLGFQFEEPIPAERVVIRNNLTDGNVVFLGVENNGPAKGARNWHVDHNGYARESNGFTRSATDVVADYHFLSAVPGDRNQWRIAGDSPQAKAGTAGSWPAYLGALPPGPAPKNGDWFTRLRARWLGIGTEKDTASSSPANAVIEPPVAVPEPPLPLAEWLKGRTILTVAQDGTGQFATIQSALRALKPTQAVEVLDRGPYREIIDVHPPADTGLISRHKTLIELHGRRTSYSAEDKGNNHHFSAVDRFRLEGLMFSAPDLTDFEDHSNTLMIGLAGDLAIENCLFRGGKPGMTGVIVYSVGQGPKGASFVLRKCVFDTTFGMNLSEAADQRPVAVIEQNWFRQTPQRSAMVLRGHPWKAIFRNNLIEGSLTSALILTATDGTRTIEVANNTFLGGGIMFHPKSVGSSRTTMRNNVIGGPIEFFNESALPEALQSWQVGGNEYLAPPDGAKKLPLAPSDFVGEPRFLSADPASTDYLHIAADAPEASHGTGSPWPAFVGALPPGPAPADGDWFSRLRTWWAADLARKEASE